MVAGVSLATAMSALAVVAAAMETWWLVTLAAMILISGTFVVAIDVNRRLRALPGWASRLARRTAAAYRPPRASKSASARPVVVAAPATDHDVLGAIRVLQSQYVGRLDRLQTSVEIELQRLRALAEAHEEHGESTTRSHAD